MKGISFKLFTTACLILGVIAVTAPGFIVSDAHAVGGSNKIRK